MTYYAPTSIRQVIETVQQSDPGQRRRLQQEWQELAEALAVMLTAHHLSVPQEWKEVPQCADS